MKHIKEIFGIVSDSNIPLKLPILIICDDNNDLAYISKLTKKEIKSKFYKWVDSKTYLDILYINTIPSDSEIKKMNAIRL